MNVTKNTWLGRKGEVYSISRSNGKRITVHHWLDNNHVEIELVSGDGRKVNFQVHSHIELVSPTSEEIQHAIDTLT